MLCTWQLVLSWDAQCWMDSDQDRALSGRRPSSGSSAWPVKVNCWPTAQVVVAAGESITASGSVLPDITMIVVVEIAPLGSVDPAPLSVVVSGAAPRAGVAVATAVGGWLPL